MAINYPSLSELLAAYKNTGVADSIQNASGNFNAAYKNADTRANNQATQAAKQQELGIQQQQTGIQQQNADTASSAEKHNFVDPSVFNAAVNGQAMPDGAQIPTNLADILVRSRESAEASKRHSEDLRAAAAEGVASRNANAALAAKEHQYATDAATDTKNQAQLQGAYQAQEKAHSWLPWMTAQEKIAKEATDMAKQRAFGSSTPQNFNSPEEAAAANPAIGSTVYIKGVPHIVGSK